MNTIKADTSHSTLRWAERRRALVRITGLMLAVGLMGLTSHRAEAAFTAQTAQTADVTAIGVWDDDDDDDDDDKKKPKPTATMTRTRTPTATATATRMPSPTSSATPALTPAVTATPSPTLTPPAPPPSPSATTTATPLPTALLTSTPTPTLTPTPPVPGFTPWRAHLPLARQNYPVVNHTSCQALVLTPPATVSQPADARFNIYRFDATGSVYIARVSNYATTGRLLLYQVLADACETSDTVTVSLVRQVDLVGADTPVILEAAPGRTYLIAVNTTGALTQQTYTFSILP